MFTPTAFAPLVGAGPQPRRFGANYDDQFAFMPNAGQYKLFVEAPAKRYPSVHTWELYNEPNFGEDLAPQAIDHSNVLYAPVMYRRLVNAAWSALHVTGHGRDTIIIGALAAHGAHSPPARSFGLPGAYGETPPLEFIRDLYCLKSNYRPTAAPPPDAQVPRDRRGVTAVPRAEPGPIPGERLVDPSYPLGPDGGTPPTPTLYHNPNFVGFSQLQNMIKALDRIQRTYGSRKRFALWNTEYGYITNPPTAAEHYLSPATAAYYDNWAEYLSWKNPRIATAMQYLLYDPNPSVGTPECGGFASGLLYSISAPTTSGCGPFVPGRQSRATTRTGCRSTCRALPPAPTGR